MPQRSWWQRIALALKNFIPGLLIIWRGIRRWCKSPPPRGVRRDKCCIDVPPSSYKRADPLIYAQYYLLKMGLAVTWDNPDIFIFDGNTLIPSSQQLKPDYVYRVEVRVWNGSYDAPAAGVGVHLSYLSFGAGTKSNPIASTIIVLGVKGSTHCPAYAWFNWRTPKTPGHYCLQARLEWADDANPDNNLGQRNCNVGAAHSPATFAFPLRNDASVRKTFVLEADTYQLPKQRACGEREPAPKTRIEESRERWKVALREQGQGLFPVPADWQVTINPAEAQLGPGEERTINVAIEPKDPAFKGMKVFNIHAYSVLEDKTRHLVGGVTLEVTKS
jgi:hypothetical protein